MISFQNDQTTDPSTAWAVHSGLPCIVSDSVRWQGRLRRGVVENLSQPTLHELYTTSTPLSSKIFKEFSDFFAIRKWLLRNHLGKKRAVGGHRSGNFFFEKSGGGALSARSGRALTSSAG